MDSRVSQLSGASGYIVSCSMEDAGAEESVAETEGWEKVGELETGT